MAGIRGLVGQFAQGPDVTGAIGRGAQVGGQLAQLAAMQRQGRAVETVDRLLASGAAAPEARTDALTKATALGGTEATLMLQQAFQALDAPEQARQAREADILARALAPVTDQASWTAAREQLARNPDVDITDLPEEFDPNLRTQIINANRDLESILSGMQPGAGFTLGTGEVRFGPGGEVIARGPEPAAADNSQTLFSNANTLRDEFVKQTEGFSEAQQGLGRVRVGADLNTAQGDIALIFGFMKTIDPGSTVREGEFATAEQTAGIPGQIVNLYNRALTGERLTPEQRQGFVEAAEAQFAEQRRSYDQTVQQYEGLAEGFGIPPASVIINRVLGDEPESEPATTTTTSAPASPIQGANIATMTEAQIQDALADPTALSDAELMAMLARLEELNSGR